jgi:hypothetical protein
MLLAFGDEPTRGRYRTGTRRFSSSNQFCTTSTLLPPDLTRDETEELRRAESGTAQIADVSNPQDGARP